MKKLTIQNHINLNMEKFNVSCIFFYFFLKKIKIFIGKIQM
jgi:hypothetical protein